MYPRSTIAFAAMLLAGAAAHADQRDFPVGAFDRLASSGSGDISVTTGKSPSVRVEASKETLDRMDIRVEGGTLKIGMKKSWGVSWSSGKIRISVTTGMLRSADMSGSGSISIDRVKVPEFSLSMSGSGDAKLPSLDADLVKMSIAGSGDINAAGRCGEARVDIAGSGDIDIGALKCTKLSGSIAGSGDITAFATTTANVSIAGSGDAVIRGGAKCTSSRAGSGTVTCG